MLRKGNLRFWRISASNQLMTPEDARHKAVELAGGPHALGRALGISGQAVSQWQRVPVERCLAVEALTGISRHSLRPDIYGFPVVLNRAA